MRRFVLFVLGLSLGGLVGLTLALLFTPASGDQLRKEAQDYYEELLAEARRAADERRQTLRMELNTLVGSDEAEASA